MKVKKYLFLAFGLVTFESVKAAAVLRKSAVVAVAPLKYAHNISADAFDYTQDLLLHGVDSTRTFNIGVARTRDLVKAAYFFSGQWGGYEKAKEALNVPPQGKNQLVKDIYLANKSRVGEQAEVRVGAGLCKQEERFIHHRIQHVEDQITKILKDPIFAKAVEAHKVPRIAVCASGGGFRAMMATAGALQALEESKLINLITFMSVLSGSTWVTIPRALGQRLDALIDGYLKYAKLPFSVNPATIKAILKENPQMRVLPWEGEHCQYPEVQVIRDNILRKFYYDQNLDAVDIYGALVAHMVLAPFDDPQIIAKYPNQKAIPIVETRQRVLFSQAALNLEGNDFGSFPLPIATAVSPAKGFFTPSKQKLTKSKMYWYEFTPYEMGTEFYDNDDKKSGAYVRMSDMGRRFKPVYEPGKGVRGYLGLKHGKLKGIYSVDNAPEYSLSNLLGTWGSAFTFSPRDAVRILGFGSILSDTKKTTPNGIFRTLIALLLRAFTPVTALFKNVRLWPASIHNFMRDVPDSPQTSRSITLVDAGIDFNLPFPPLLRQAREVDVIIVIDASMPVFKKTNDGFEITELVKAEEWAQAQGIPFPQIVGSEAYNKAITLDENDRVESAVTVFEGTDGAPTVIFIPLVDNEYTDKTEFKVAKCFEEDCNTFNFKYSEDSVKNVVRTVSETVMGNVDLIEKALVKVTKQKLGIPVKEKLSVPPKEVLPVPLSKPVKVENKGVKELPVEPLVPRPLTIPYSEQKVLAPAA